MNTSQNKIPPLKNRYATQKPAIYMFKLIMSKVLHKDLAKHQINANDSIKIDLLLKSCVKI